VQPHDELVIEALRMWKADAVNLKLHLLDELARAPQPASGTGKIERARARALLRELSEFPKASPVLYRGSHIDPFSAVGASDVLTSWTARRKVAENWAERNGGTVWILPKGTASLRVADYLPNCEIDNLEKEWVVNTGTLFLPRSTR
jgi:hypothetical protein